MIESLLIVPINFTGLKAKEFPKEIAAQNMQASIMIKDLISRVLGREEPFTITVRKGSGTLRYARDSSLLLLPPVEVSYGFSLVARQKDNIFNVLF